MLVVSAIFMLESLYEGVLGHDQLNSDVTQSVHFV